MKLEIEIEIEVEIEVEMEGLVQSTSHVVRVVCSSAQHPLRVVSVGIGVFFTMACDQGETGENIKHSKEHIASMANRKHMESI